MKFTDLKPGQTIKAIANVVLCPPDLKAELPGAKASRILCSGGTLRVTAVRGEYVYAEVLSNRELKFKPEYGAKIGAIVRVNLSGQKFNETFELA